MTKLSSEKPELFKGRHFNHLLTSKITGPGTMVLHVWEAVLAA
jgi:hypothetical protein